MLNNARSCILNSTLYKFQKKYIKFLRLSHGYSGAEEAQQEYTYISRYQLRTNQRIRIEVSRESKKERVRVTLQLTVSQSVCLSWCRSPARALDQISSCLKVTVMSMWGALCDERSGLSFVSHSR
jgi:hypothetical protein